MVLFRQDYPQLSEVQHVQLQCHIVKRQSVAVRCPSSAVSRCQMLHS